MSAKLTITIPEWVDKICVSPLMLYRRLKYGEPFRKIYLGEDTYAIVDPDVYYEKCRYNWFLTGNGINVYAIREKMVGHKKTVRSSLHREIMKPGKGKLIDHRYNDTLNNLISNLRQATYSQNAMNRPKTKSKTSSRYRGVSWKKSNQKWQVRIEWERNGRRTRKTIGYFDKDKEDQAGRAYDMAALKYHKDFANINFPREYYVKTRTGYKFTGDSEPQKNISLPGRFVKYLMMKGRC